MSISSIKRKEEDMTDQKESPIDNNDNEFEEVEIDQEKLESYMRKLKDEQNLPYGLIGGLIAALIGAGLWALLTALTKYQIGFMAIGVGFIVGYAIRFFGKGIDKIFGISGAVLALLGCVLGNFFTICYLVSVSESIPFFQLLFSTSLSTIVNVIASTFDVIDLLFYGIAVYEGYRFSFRQLTEEEVKQFIK